MKAKKNISFRLPYLTFSVLIRVLLAYNPVVLSLRSSHSQQGKVRHSAPLYRHWGKVKCPLVQALRLWTGRTAHRGSRGIALPFHNFGTRRGWGVSVTPRPLFTPGKDPVPIVREAGWAPGPVWTGAENLDSTGIRSPDRPARSQSLYRLSYPGPFLGIIQSFDRWV